MATMLYVGGVPAGCHADVVQAAFLPFGDILSIHVDGRTAWVEFEEEADAQDAIDNMDASELYGCTLRVSRRRRKGEEEEGRPVWQQEGWIQSQA